MNFTPGVDLDQSKCSKYGDFAIHLPVCFTNLHPRGVPFAAKSSRALFRHFRGKSCHKPIGTLREFHQRSDLNCTGNKRKHNREQRYGRRRRRYTTVFTKRLLQVIVVILVTCVLKSEDVYLSGLPRPIIPDIRFDLTNCGTGTTDGLQAEYLFRFITDQIYELVDSLCIPMWL